MPLLRDTGRATRSGMELKAKALGIGLRSD